MTRIVQDIAVAFVVGSLAAYLGIVRQLGDYPTRAETQAQIELNQRAVIVSLESIRRELEALNLKIDRLEEHAQKR